MALTRGSKRTSSGKLKMDIPLENTDLKTSAFSTSEIPCSSSVVNPGPSTSQNRPNLFALPPNLVKTMYMPQELKLIMDYSEEEFLSDASHETEYSETSKSETGDEVIETEATISQQLTDRFWTQNRQYREEIPFAENTGLTVELSGNEPIDMFKTVLNEKIIELTVTESNKFADKLRTQCKSPKARINNWKPLTIDEFLTWLGLLFHMGTIPLTRLKDYWSTYPLFSIPIFRSCMSRDRFSSILQSLHFTDKATSTDRLTKIQPLLDVFHTTMNSIYQPTKQLCIDECMLLWRGRLVFRVYLKGERHKSGIKLYMLKEPSGLVLRVVVNVGASDSEIAGKGHAKKVVYKLLAGRLDCGHSLFIHNYYNSVNLVHELLNRKTYATGTLRADQKGNPSNVRMAKLKPNEIAVTFSDESVCVLKWRDRREVLMISSEFGASLVESTNRRGLLLSKPETVIKYNEAMGGSDHVDKMMAYYPIERKTIKWYKKLAIHTFHIILINSFFLYRKQFPHLKTTLHDFRLSVISSLILPSFNTALIQNPMNKKQNIIEHIPKQYKPKDGRGRPDRKRCKVCYLKKIRKDTMYFCPFCFDNPPLCKEPCFEEYHKK